MLNVCLFGFFYLYNQQESSCWLLSLTQIKGQDTELKLFQHINIHDSSQSVERCVRKWSHPHLPSADLVTISEDQGHWQRYTMIEVNDA